MDAISISQQVIKPMEKRSIKVCATMGVPHVGWNDFWGCAQDALFQFGIPVRKFTGCFWSQQLQTAIETCVRDEMEYILCLDYDTMFGAAHLKRILQYTQIRPDADAIAGLQRKRQSDAAIMSRHGETETEMSDTLIPVDSAHFGFTILNVAKLRNMPKPWFQEIPNEQGGWGEGAIYPDNFFWARWKETGNSLFVAADIRVGHLDLMVSEFDEHFQPRHIYLNEWTKANRPHAVNACMD